VVEAQGHGKFGYYNLAITPGIRKSA